VGSQGLGELSLVALLLVVRNVLEVRLASRVWWEAPRPEEGWVSAVSELVCGPLGAGQLAAGRAWGQTCGGEGRRRAGGRTLQRQAPGESLLPSRYEKNEHRGRVRGRRRE